MSMLCNNIFSILFFWYILIKVMPNSSIYVTNIKNTNSTQYSMFQCTMMLVHNAQYTMHAICCITDGQAWISPQV